MTEFDEIPYLKKLSMFAREMGSGGLAREGSISGVSLKYSGLTLKIRAHDCAPSVFTRPLKLGGVLKPFCSATAV